MNAPSTQTLTLLSSLLLLGLAGSLHCAAMCGPLLLGFGSVFDRTRVTIGGQSIARPRFPLAGDFLFYHTGRIWTYAVLGFFAGSLGSALAAQAETLAWQRALGIGAGTLMLLTGVVLTGIVPGVNLDRLAGTCAVAPQDQTEAAARRNGPRRWIAILARTPGSLARLLLGAMMGLLPCGLVYAALLQAIALASPAWAALGMIAFGLGTIPSLSAVLIGHRLLPARWRHNGHRFAAALVVATGVWMIGRSLLAEKPGDCPFCHT